MWFTSRRRWRSVCEHWPLLSSVSPWRCSVQWKWPHVSQHLGVSSPHCTLHSLSVPCWLVISRSRVRVLEVTEPKQADLWRVSSLWDLMLVWGGTSTSWPDRSFWTRSLIQLTLWLCFHHWPHGVIIQTERTLFHLPSGEEVLGNFQIFKRKSCLFG